MHLSPYAVRNKKNFQNFGKSKKALARFSPTTVLNNCISPEFKPLHCKHLQQNNALKSLKKT
jgi:hypothetical protein